MSMTAKLFTERTTVWDWYKLASRIDMAPEYQRRAELWSIDKRRLLIDSILNGYDIPKIYLADFSQGAQLENKSRKLFAVIDGKQRLEAIFSFIDDGFALGPKESAPGYPEGSLDGLKFEAMTQRHPQLANAILDYELAVVSVVADDPADIQKMFVRLNFGVSVNAAERRNAKPGAVPSAIREIVEHRFFKTRIAFTTKRSEEKNLAGKVLMFETQGGITDTKASRLDKFAEAYQEPNTWEDILKQVVRVEEILDRLTIVFKEKDPLLASSGQIPVYYWLARNNWNDDPSSFRAFLDHFDDQVKKQYRNLPIDPGEDAIMLTEYYRLTRTVNDKESIEGRYKMLASQWKLWNERTQASAKARSSSSSPKSN